MRNKNLKKTSIINLCLGYLLTFLFLLLITLNIKEDKTLVEVVENEPTSDELLFNETHKQEGVSYIDRQLTVTTKPITIDSDNADVVILEKGRANTINNPDHILIDRSERIIVDGNLDYETSKINRNYNNDTLLHRSHGSIHGDSDRVSIDHKIHDRIDSDIDIGLLDRRLSELDNYETLIQKDEEKIGINKEDSIDLSGLTISKDDDDIELGEIPLDFSKANKGYGIGKGGELYAYNYPSRGLGAGIGSSAIGAGAGGGAGLGAGIGEGLLNGETVPTLGGVGDGAKSVYGEPKQPSGVGGLVNGAGAGGAAGLSQGYITEKVGLGMGSGLGLGSGSSRGYNYNHLPKNGSLHIMIHVDGSGSILNTRKQLEEMKETLLKKALLPYYNNNEDLYNKRVTIVNDSGERTLRFFTQAAKKDNVLAIAFQDEAQPAYHLPNFNKKPEDHYLDDLGNLKKSLNGYGGTYRAVMFQVDRGKTFAKSFKEFVGNSFKGEGYLDSNNLKRYHRDNNSNHIKNKNGIIFSDEYHAKDEGDPQYYLDLIFKASKRIGLDLDIYGGGLRDGKKTSSI
jgi:hypothetical protein